MLTVEEAAARTFDDLMLPRTDVDSAAFLLFLLAAGSNFLTS